MKVYCTSFIPPRDFISSQDEVIRKHNGSSYRYMGFTVQKIPYSEQLHACLAFIGKVALGILSAGILFAVPEYQKWISHSFKKLCVKEHRLEYYLLLNASPEHEIKEKQENSLDLVQKLQILQGPIQKPFWNGTHQLDEGLKVRTFSLELLSNIEDIAMAKPPLFEFDKKAPLNQFKLAVKAFLEQGALEKKAGLVDFSRLLDLLKLHLSHLEETDRKKMSLIIEKHFCLVSIQQTLSERVFKPKKDSRWDKIRVMITSGLLTPDLLIRSEEASKLGLRSLPPLPCLRTHYNLFPIVDSINLLKRNAREAGRWVVHHTGILTFRGLCQSIQRSCQSLKEQLGKSDFYLLTVKGKSQEWMADIAYRYLPKEKMPSGILQIGKDGGVTQHCDKLVEALAKTDASHYVLFDDASYTGTQLFEYVTHFKKVLEESRPFPVIKNIYFVYGFSAKRIQERVDQLCKDWNFEKYKVKIHFIPGKQFDNIEEMMKKEGLSKEMEESIEEVCNTTMKSLLTTQWKTPDFVSTPMFVTTGHIRKDRASVGELRTIQNCRNVSELDGIPPITDIRTPYSSKP